MQQRYLGTMEEVFGGVTIIGFPMLDTEIVGKENLKKAEKALMGFNKYALIQ